MNKSNFSCFAGRASLIGDSIMFLPVLNYLELKYPNSYKIFPISKKTCQSVELFINHPLIDKLYVMDEWEKLSKKDIELISKSDVSINPFPQHPPCPGLTVGIDNFWYNEYTCVEETFRMAGIDVEEYRKMPDGFKKPKLEKWFPVEMPINAIGVWPFAGYNKEPKRSPSKQWWVQLCLMLINEGYQIIQFGHPNDPRLFDHDTISMCDYLDMRGLSFFEQIKLSLACDFCINSDSGSGWVLGAYGQKQISLITNHAPNHSQNLLAFAPENWAGNSINLFGYGSCDAIPQQDVISSIKKLIP